MKNFLRAVSMLGILRLLMDMLLPEGKMRCICDMILGLVLMRSLLEAARMLLHGGLF
ncbi:MAG: hypothetical protein IKW00_09665 [Clostridia bacterium]|nr:hypothetical protein [Clostridia bacterium]